MVRMRKFVTLLIACAVIVKAPAQTFILPTPNQALVKDSALSEKFLVGTTGKPWQSGGFGCVRSEGLKMHEGLDIRCTQRDKRQEPIDPVVASAAGTVAYVSDKPGLSNYGRYIVLKHKIDGLEICTLYAHLSEIADGIAVGQTVKQGERIATMGRSTNTREGISKERAHCHFEIDFILSDHFPEWHQKFEPGQRNDHGAWNGHNLVAIDPTPILLAAAREGTNFSLLKQLHSRKELCRVLVRDTNFSMLHRYAPLVKANPVATKEGAAGYEIALDFNGAPIEFIPRAASEIKRADKIRLLNVNQAELNRCHCGHLVVLRQDHYELSNAGLLRVGLMTY
jgi:hypothetical protein